MPYTKLDLQTLNDLSEDEVKQTLTAAELPLEREPYTEEEIQSGFDVIRSYFNNKQVSDYAAAAELFKQQRAATQQLEAEMQAKTKKATKSKKPGNPNGNGVDQSECLNVLELLALASKHCQTRVSLTEFVQILDICRLPDKEQYTSSEGDRFLEACDLLKQQGKTRAEVAAHFGITEAAEPLNTLSNTQILDELKKLLGQTSSIQADQIKALLPQIATEQLEEIRAWFNRATLMRLREMVHTGEIEADIRRIGASQLGKGFGLLPEVESRSQHPKSLSGL